MMDMIRRRPALTATLAVVLLAAVIVGVLRLLAPPPATEPAEPAPAQPAAPVPQPASRVEQPPAAPVAGAAGDRPDWRSATTRLDAVAETFPDALRAAGGGDAAARYHVARTLRFCQLGSATAPGAPESVQRACSRIVASPGLADLSAGPAGDAWVSALNDAIRAGEPRALAYAALHCVDGSPCDPMAGQDRGMSLASAQSRAGRAIASGDAEAIYHAGLAIADDSIGGNALKGAAWMLVACERGYDCSAANQLNEKLACDPGAAGCVPGSDLRDRLQAELGADGYAEAYARAQEYAQLLQAGEPPVRSWSFGR